MVSVHVTSVYAAYASWRPKVSFLFLTTLSLLISELCWLVIVVGVEDLTGATINHDSSLLLISSSSYLLLILLLRFLLPISISEPRSSFYSIFLLVFVFNYSFKFLTPISAQSTTVCTIWYIFCFCFCYASRFVGQRNTVKYYWITLNCHSFTIIERKYCYCDLYK